jgi:hypothetical protein
MSQEEWLHKVSDINRLLFFAQRRTRVCITVLFVIASFFAATMAISSAEGAHDLDIVPWIFIGLMVIIVVFMARINVQMHSQIRSLLEAYNREFTPRGMQWKLVVERHHKHKSMHVIKLQFE